ncbi:MAG: fibronectin type III domain-containing protein [Defluviitaleaceae bacterium]|nr:fibronectin type III domain-containing protein [Defluviitaleaceae bacterium]
MRIPKIKKVIAVFLAMTIFAVYMPFTVLANPQNPINSDFLSIEDTAATGSSGAWNPRLTWQWLQDRDAAAGQNPADIHPPERFNIHVRNATTAGPFTGATINSDPLVSVPRTDIVTHTADVPSIPNTVVTQGSIFSYIVVPEHSHWVNVPPTVENPAGIAMIPVRPTTEQVLAVNNLTGRSPQRLYMTDIVVTEINTNEPGITIEWHNPTFDGMQVFDGYRISFRSSGSPNFTELTRINQNSFGVTVVSRGGRSFWQFEIPTLTIENILTVGTNYDFRIEPMHSNRIVTNSFTGEGYFNSGQWISIDGIEYQLAFGIGREFIVEGIHLAPSLSLVPIGSDYISLNWDVPLSVNSQNGRIELWSSTEEVFDFSILPPGRLETSWVNTPASELASFHVMRRPTVPTWFIIRYIMPVGGQPVNIGPQNPPPSPHMVSNLVFFDPNFNDFIAYRPMIRDYEIHSNGQPTIQLAWDSFVRRAFTEEEQNLASHNNGYIIDRVMEYEFFVTDNLEHLREMIEFAKENIITPEEANLIISSSTVANMPTIPGPLAVPPTSASGVNRFSNATQQISTFFNSTQGQNMPIVANNVYYIGILARRVINGERSLQVSQAGEIGIFVPPTDPVTTAPNDVPVRIQTINGEPNITHNSIGIEWNFVWYEAFNPITNNWYDKIGIQNGNLVFGNVPNAINLWENSIALQPYDVARNAIISALGTDPGANLVIRQIDVNRGMPASFQFHVTPFTSIGENPEEYIRTIQTNDAPWTAIPGQGSEVENSGNPANHRYHVLTELQPNTTYAIFFRAVNTNGPAMGPSYVSGTTIITRPGLVPTPTSPILSVVETTDSSIRLRWNGSLEDFRYELFHSMLLVDYPTGGGRVAITPEYIAQNAQQVGENIYLTVSGLFPNTTYHFWIRAFNSEDVYSGWSNPATGTTLTLQPPPPPTAINFASATSLNIYNLQNSSEIEQGPYNMILEFGRIHADIVNTVPGPARTAYQSSPNDRANWLTSSGLPNSTHLVNFRGLVANRRHYVRARTLLTVFRQGTNIVWEYSYELQISDNPNFLDAVSIILPTPTHTANVPGEVLVITGDWNVVYPFWTQMTDTEFDSDVNPDLFPLPDQDFYYIGPNPGNNFTLTFRIRGNEIGADGNRDNQVDQRFISRLVTNRVFNFDVDVSSWNGPFPIRNRVVEIPFGVIEAFNERQIDLNINAGSLSLTIPYNSIVTDEVLNMPNINRFTPTLINLSEDNITPTGAENGLFTTPQNLTVSFGRGPNAVNISEFERPIEVSLAIPQAHNVNSFNLSAYINNPNSGGWSRMPSIFNAPLATPNVPTLDMQRGNIVFNTRELGAYTAISTAPAVGIAGQQTLEAMHRVSTNIRITDLANYDENQVIHANQFNQLVYAIARGNDSVSINTALNSTNIQSLGRSGMLVSGNNVSQEAGISSLVRLFEVREGSPVTFFPGVAQSSISNINTANPTFLENLLKAEALGFFRVQNIEPTEPMTFGDVFHILDIILN